MCPYSERAREIRYVLVRTLIRGVEFGGELSSLRPRVRVQCGWVCESWHAGELAGACKGALCTPGPACWILAGLKTSVRHAGIRPIHGGRQISGAPMWLMLNILLAIGPGLSAESLREALERFTRGAYGPAATLLSECLSLEEASSDCARGLYTLATIRRAEGNDKEAAEIMRQLVARHASSPWAPHAHSYLSELAAGRNDWDEAIDHVAEVIALYVTGDHAALDDPFCHRAFKQIISYHARLHSEVDEAEQYRLLRSRFAVDTATGRVIALRIGMDPSGEDTNLVLNPGFEWDGRQVAVPVGWRSIGTEPDSDNDLDGVIAQGGFSPPHEGGFCTGKFTGWGVHRGWVYQRVRVTPGYRYEVGVFASTPAQEDRPGQVRLGMDVEGGTDPLDERVQWTEYASPREAYEKLVIEEVEIGRADDPHLTVFLELRQDHPAAPNAMLFDDAWVRRAR